MSSEIWKKMGQRAFGASTAKRPAASASDATPAAKKPADPANGLSEGQQPAAPTALRPPTVTEPLPEKTPPPFFIEVTTAWPELAEKLKTLVDGDFVATARGKHFRVRTSTIANFRKIQRHLLLEKVPFHTFTLGGGRNLKVVISGLPGYIEEDNLRAALEKEKLDVETACRLRSRRGRSSRWLVTFVRDCERGEGSEPAAGIWRVRELLHVRITCSAYKKPPGPPQCYHCQRFGHGSANCGRPRRCVRCGGAHNISACQQPYADRICCNCGGGHQANWRGCPTFADARSAAEPRPARRPPPRQRRQPPAKTDATREDPAQPEEDDLSSSTEEEGFAVARKRRKRQPRNRANRAKKPATTETTTEKRQATEKRPVPRKAAKAPAQPVAPKPPPAPAPARPVPAAEPATTEPATTAEAPATREEVFAALSEICQQVRTLTELVRALMERHH